MFYEKESDKEIYHYAMEKNEGFGDLIIKLKPEVAVDQENEPIKIGQLKFDNKILSHYAQNLENKQMTT